MEENENHKIIKAIGNLEGTVNVGFENIRNEFRNVHESIKGVHARQDIANGRTGFLEKENIKQEMDIKWLKKNYWIIVTSSISTFLSILVYMLYNVLKL